MPNIYLPYLYRTFTQTLMYGAYVTTFVHCLRWLLFDDEGWKLRHWRRINWSMLAISVLLFLFSAINLALKIEALVTYDSPESQVFGKYFVMDTTESMTMMTVNGVLIYRCWVVFGKSWRAICIPTLLWLGCYTCAILRLYYYAILGATKLNLTRALHPFYVFMACSITINVYVTSLIVYRIMSEPQATKAIRRVGHLFRATRIIAESGILYTLTSILYLNALFFSLDPALRSFGVVASAINFSMAGIAFNLILIRVGQNRSNVDESPSWCVSPTKEAKISTLQFNISDSISLTDVEESVV